MARSVPDKVPVTAANHNGACPDGARFPSSAAAVRAGLRVPGSSLSACWRVYQRAAGRAVTVPSLPLTNIEPRGGSSSSRMLAEKPFRLIYRASFFI